MKTRRSSVRDLGRKARARLEEERSKRPEIVRLEESLVPTTKKRKSPPVTAPVINNKKAKRRPVKPRRKRNNSAVQDKYVDRWMPSTSSLPVARTKEDRSRWVQVHGLPVGTLPAQVRRFFSGLDPQHVFLLASDRNHRLDHLLDASTTEPPRKRGGVSRCENLRVLVQFDSAPTAGLAADRSGEVMPLQNETQNVDNMTGAAIAVTHLTKDLASHLVQNLVMEAVPGIPLQEGLEQVEQHLDPRVSNILWKEAEEQLVKNKNNDGKRIPYKSTDYEKLASYQNTLLRTYQELATVESMDPTLVATDPLVSLTARAASCLKQEVQRVEQRLLQARRWNSLFGTVSKAVENLEV